MFFRGLTTGVTATAIAAIAWDYQNKKVSDESSDSSGCFLQSRLDTIVSSLGTPSKAGVDRILNNHVLHYSHSKRLPLWVQQHLSQDSLKGNHDRSSAKFHSDDGIEMQWRGHNDDYKKSGWSRGHMAPAADNKANEMSMSDSFKLSNIVPQDYDNNSDYWNRLEMYCRDITNKYSNVWVTSGPAFVPRTTPDNKKFVTYEVIGANEVAVPTHLYKVIVAENAEGKRFMGSFLIPNAPIPKDPPLTEFQVSLEHLEKRVGFKFYDKFDRTNASDLCSNNGCAIMSKLSMRQYVYVKQIWRTKDVNALNTLWGKIQKKRVPVTAQMKAAYEEKQLQLLSAVPAVAVEAA